jgi:hypothetical protein
MKDQGKKCIVFILGLCLIVALLVVILAIFLSGGGADGRKKDGEVGIIEIDLLHSRMVVYGKGLMPEGAVSSRQARLRAERAGIDNARANALEELREWALAFDGRSSWMAERLRNLVLRPEKILAKCEGKWCMIKVIFVFFPGTASITAAPLHFSIIFINLLRDSDS